jgi:N-acetylglucosaminyldiphosphoundecaprenol N-acetyl-beta-D-mannosaminyltransferase
VTERLSPERPSFPILGTRVNALTIKDLHQVIAHEVAGRTKCVIASQNLHAVYVARGSERMQNFYARADYVRIDGMSLALWARALGHPVSRDHRVTWVDWLRPLMREAAQRGWRVFYLGSGRGVAERGAEVLRAEIPGVQIATHHGYFDPTPGCHENRSVVDQIRQQKPHLLLVGMGMPRQERWILDNLDDLCPMVVLPCGACIDYVAGVVRTPPRWMGRIGLEWLGRLVTEPRRLGPRYLVEPWLLSDLFLKDLLTVVRRRTGLQGS